MKNFDVPRYEKVIDGALNQRNNIEKAADEISKKEYSNIFLIGVGGTYAHSLSLQYMLESQSDIETHAVIASEFMAMDHRRFSEDSICIFSTRSGNTKEILEAQRYCQEAGATVVTYVANEGTPACNQTDYLFLNYAEDDHLGESIYLINVPFIMRLMYNDGYFPEYDKFMDQLKEITSYLIKGKEQYDKKCNKLAKKHKNTDYHMVVGSGNVWGEAYDYAMCILEEMQWIKTKSIHAAEFFHGTLELVEEDTSIIMLYGEDETRSLMDRVYDFADKITNQITIFDTKDIELPFDKKFRKFLSPLVIYALTERFSYYLSIERDHPLTKRRYYRQMDY